MQWQIYSSLSQEGSRGPTQGLKRYLWVANIVSVAGWGHPFAVQADHMEMDSVALVLEMETKVSIPLSDFENVFPYVNICK